MEQLARGGGGWGAVLDNNQPLFKWLPGKEIEDFQHDQIIQEEEEEETYENQAHENKIEQRQEREQEEANYITDLETIVEEEEK